jgi:hypothetical protein
MLEYIQFYTKNLSNFAILLLIGVSIAILDITLRNVVRGVYLNVRENMKLRHRGGGREGMTTDGKDGKDGANVTADKDAKDATSKEDDEACPKDCTAVEALRTKLTGLIENAAKLQKDIQENDETIKKQHKTIENMQKSIQKLIDKSK